MEGILRSQLVVRVVHHDARVCKDEGAREGMEAGRGMFGYISGAGAALHVHFQGEKRS